MLNATIRRVLDKAPYPTETVLTVRTSSGELVATGPLGGAGLPRPAPESVTVEDVRRELLVAGLHELAAQDIQIAVLPDTNRL